MTTSHRISLLFTSIAVGILMLFAGIVNAFFFTNRYGHEIRSIHTSLQMTPPQPGKNSPRQRLVERFSQVITLPASDERVSALEQGIRRRNISYLEGDWYMREKRGNTVAVKYISPLIKRQKKLMQLSFLTLLGSSLGIFFLSKWFVRLALKDLKHIGKYLADWDIERGHTSLALNHLPEHDEIRRVADALNLAGRKLHTQVDDIRRFIDHAAHEMKTPLMAMQSTIDLGLKRSSYESSLHKTSELIQQLHTLFDALLFLQSGQAVYVEQQDSVDLHELTTMMLAQEPRLAKKRLIVDLSENKPSSITTHRGALMHILVNLLSNAVTYSPEGGHLSIVYDKTFRSITDTGPGIAREHIQHIREPFRQADKTKSTDVGMGLGLSIVKKYCDLLGYRCDVQSIVDGGTTFTVYFS